MSGFNAAQRAHDANTEPPESCPHEEWETQERTYITSETQDVPVVCTACQEVGSIDFNGEDLSVNWDS